MGRASSLVVFALAALAPQLRAEDVAVVVELADGSVLPGTVAARELELVEGGARTKLPLRDVRHLALSTSDEKENAALDALVAGLRDQLAADDPQVRDAASRTLQALPATAAPFLARLEKDPDPEVVQRAQVALRSLPALQDGRDLVILERRVARGWVALERLELVTALGTLTLARGELRALRSAAAGEALADVLGGELPPPMASRPPRLPLQVVVTLQGGAKLVGLVPADALALVDDQGRRLCSDGLRALVLDRAASPLFKAQRAGVPEFAAALAAKELTITSGARAWRVPAAAIDALVVGGAAVGGGSLADLARAMQQGGAPPTQRFWVHINDQQANCWDSPEGLGMTWSLHKVVGKAALVGSDPQTNAYQGDTPPDVKLPLLCVRRADLAPPDGVEADFYHGWTGYELRLSRPVAGSELTSLEAANALVQAEFGAEWEMAEFHSPEGGWSWWGSWAEPE